MQTFVTERLILTPLAVADADALYAIYSHPEILKLYPEKPIAHPSDTIPFMERITADGNLVWSIRFKENQPMIGDCALHHRNKMEGTIEIGGALLPEFWGIRSNERSVHSNHGLCNTRNEHPYFLRPYLCYQYASYPTGREVGLYPPPYRWRGNGDDEKA